MDFQARQYDPQLGRFLGIDPLAGAGGQQVLSPYHAMGCNPVTLIDPLGLKSFNAADMLFDYGVPSLGAACIEGGSVVFGGSWLEPFEKQLERLNERAAMLAEEAHLSATTGLYQAFFEFLAVYGSEILLSGGTLVFSTDSKNEVIYALVIAKGKDQLGGEEQANGGEESNEEQQASGGNNWFFEVNAEVTVGLQVGGAVNVGELNAGLKANLVNVKLWEGKATQTGSNRAPWVTSSTLIGKNGKYTVSNSVDLGPGLWEQSFDRNIGQTGYINDSHNYKFSLGPFTYNSNPQEGSYIEIGGKAALILGISGSIKFGLR